MDQFCVNKYGVSIFKLHRPLTDPERAIFLPENEKEVEWGEEDDEPDDGDDEMEFEVSMTMSVHLPETGMADKETVMANIFSAFDLVNTRSWINEYCFDDKDTVCLNCTTDVMASDSIDAENSCMEFLETVGKELKKFGYQVTDISCDAEEV